MRCEKCKYNDGSFYSSTNLAPTRLDLIKEKKSLDLYIYIIVKIYRRNQSLFSGEIGYDKNAEVTIAPISKVKIVH